jgi:RNA polymerase sigma-70 factor (ECF subfamily)
MTEQVQDGMLRDRDVAGWEPGVIDTQVARSRPAGASVELVVRARRGDAAAFDTLTRHGIDRAYRLALAILRSETDARDAVQDAYLAAWRQLPKLREPDRFEAWLERIIVNTCRMQLRHHRVVRLREIDVPDPADHVSPGDPRMAVPAPDDGVADAELIRRAMDHLGADHRALLVLHHIQDRPVAEIAATLGIPAGTVKWRLHAARAALQRAVEEEQR